MGICTYIRTHTRTQSCISASMHVRTLAPSFSAADSSDAPSDARAKLLSVLTPGRCLSCSRSLSRTGSRTPCTAPPAPAPFVAFAPSLLCVSRLTLAALPAAASSLGVALPVVPGQGQLAGVLAMPPCSFFACACMYARMYVCVCVRVCVYACVTHTGKVARSGVTQHLRNAAAYTR